MGVTRQIGENLLRCWEGALGVDDPLTLTHWGEPVGECIRVGQIDVLAEELQLPVTMQVLELFEEAPAKQAREHPYRKEEPRLAGQPPIGIGRKPAARHDAMHMRMVSQ